MNTILKTYHKHSNIVSFHKYEEEGVIYEESFNENGETLTYKDSDGLFYEIKYHKNGKPLSLKSSTGFSFNYTYHKNNNTRTYKDSNGFEFIYDENNKLLQGNKLN